MASLGHNELGAMILYVFSDYNDESSKPTSVNNIAFLDVRNSDADFDIRPTLLIKKDTSSFISLYEFGNNDTCLIDI